jgi:hypothetical protein
MRMRIDSRAGDAASVLCPPVFENTSPGAQCVVRVRMIEFDYFWNDNDYVVKQPCAAQLGFSFL